MDYEKKYNEALERAKQFHDKDLFAECNGNLVEYIFPELAESEDERIRKGLIALLKFGLEDGSAIAPGFNETKEQALAWLEKQGEKPQGKTALEAIKEEEVDNQICVKTNDKVEPKFKVGDWVILTAGELSTTLQIANVDINKKLYWFNDSSYLPIVDEECLHLWTIQDAKDGDVLIDKSGGRECPFIFKETKPSDIKTDILNPLAVLGYCGIGGAGFTKGSGWRDTANCIYYPATKEQRDLLFAKMKEAGYEWDKEKKELKNVEQNSTWSEDEKIRKALIAYFRNHQVGINIFYGIKGDDILAWLEKQVPVNCGGNPNEIQ